MADNISLLITTAKTFCFASGQTLTLDQDTIKRISYLDALVSSADCFESARDEHGHYKLDRCIEYKHFSFILESISFHSVRQLFTHLPKQYDVIPIIALLDFLGIGPQPDPTLREVDKVFFSNLVYSPLLEEYLLIIRQPVIQDMAVRFAIAMAKEEYDFTDYKVSDQIYWFIMFIASAYKLFGPRLRHHVYTIAEHCFSLFQPSLLKLLKRIIQRTLKDEEKVRSITHQNDIDPEEDDKYYLEQLYGLPSDAWRWLCFEKLKLDKRHHLILNRTYIDPCGYRAWRLYKPERLVEPAYRRILEIMYERLQSEICERASIEIYKKKSLHNIINEDISTLLIDDIQWHKVCIALPEQISSIWMHEQVEKEIRELIMEELCLLKPKLEQRQNELVEKIKEYDQNRETLNSNLFYLFDGFAFGRSSFENLQEEVLSYKLLLDSLNQGSSIEVEIYQRVLYGLHINAQKQFQQWVNTQQNICKLYDELSSCETTINILSIIPNSTYTKYKIPVYKYKPIPKRQRKHSTR